jgi:hypothetical protein
MIRTKCGRYKDDRPLEQQLKEDDPDNRLQDELQELLAKHWDISEPAKCIRWDFGKKHIFQVNAPGQDDSQAKEKDEYFVFVRLFEHMNNRESRLEQVCA